MPQFTDNQGRQWSLMVDAPTAMRIRSECDPDFLKNDFIDEKNSTFARLRNDPVLLCRVVYLLCDKQRIERGISEEDFYLQVLGDAIDRASEALLAAILSFTPRRTREVLEAFARQDAFQQQMIAKTMEKLGDPALAEELMQRLDQQIDARLGEISTPLSSATSTPDLSESSPAD